MGSEMEKDKERNIIFKVEKTILLKSYLFPFAINEHMIPKQPKGKNVEVNKKRHRSAF